jgi:putative aldouronate transport system permease protein
MYMEKTNIKETFGDRIFFTIVFTVLMLVTAIILYPLILVLSSSISQPDLVATGKVWLWPVGINIDGYIRVFQDPAIMRGYANTVFYAVVGTAINMAVTVPAAYSMSKKSLPGRGFFTFYFLFIMYFSGGMIPTFLLINGLGLYNTRTVLLVMGAFGAFNFIICRTFFAAIPQELEEAAEIDGATPIRSFFTIVLPISQALLGVMVLRFAVGHWNSFFTAMIYTVDQRIVPLQLVLRRILIMDRTSIDMMGDASEAVDEIMSRVYLVELVKYAVIVVSALPLLILYPFLQKYFVKGVMIGSVKG